MDIKELVAGFRQVATASVSDAVDKIVGKTGFLPEALDHEPVNKIVGPAVTYWTTTEFLPKHALDVIDEAEAGSVIVIRPMVLLKSLFGVVL